MYANRTLIGICTLGRVNFRYINIRQLFFSCPLGHHRFDKIIDSERFGGDENFAGGDTRGGS